jgi:hypothetical protein
VRKMIPSYLLWCLWMEINDRSFEDSERTLVELKYFLFETLYHLTTTLYLNLHSLHYCLDLLSLFNSVSPIYLNSAFCAFNNILFTYKKGKSPHTPLKLLPN